MKLAASNIGWTAADDETVYGLLTSLGFEGLEIAPTRIWPEPLKTTHEQRLAFRRDLEARGLRIVAMQALVFGRPELQLFGDERSREALAEHLRGMIELGADLGAHALVFGSPRNRLRGGLEPERALEVAELFFRGLGNHALSCGTSLCIEANPVQYGCDFVTSTEEAARLVRRVGSPGFCLHLDAGGMTLAGAAAKTVETHAREARHFHASEPHLAPVGTTSTDHVTLGRVLGTAGYQGWVSLEMRAPDGAQARSLLAASLEHVARCYGMTGP